MLNAYYVLGERIAGIYFDLAKDCFSIYFRGSQIDAYKDDVARMEVYSNDGTCYEAMGFTWAPVDIFVSIRMLLSKVFKRLKANALLRGEYHLQAIEKKIELSELKNKLFLRSQETFTVKDVKKVKDLLDEVSSFSELEIALQAVSFTEGFESRDLLLVVPVHPDLPLRLVEDKDQLDLVMEDFGEGDSEAPIYVYSLREHVVFLLNQGMTKSRPLTLEDLQQMKKYLVKPNYYTFAEEDLMHCSSLLKIIVFLSMRIGEEL